uniref:Uncharacterized protein n=1 Tax=Romanomermis culicivorax TaxID=13658 RepID=A0A915HY57_ROMCU
MLLLVGAPPGRKELTPFSFEDLLQRQKFMENSLKLKLGVQKQPLPCIKSKPFALNLMKDDNRQQIANMEEMIDQVARKFTNSVDDNDHDLVLDVDAGHHMNQRAQTSS